jgi:integrase
MASISTDRHGNKRLKFYDHAGKQGGIRLGKVDQRTAERLCRDVEELLVARQMGQPVHASTAERLGRLSGHIRDRFVRAGLLEPLEQQRRDVALQAFLEAYIDGRTDVKASTKNNNYRHAKLVLVEYFGADRRLASITPGDAEDFRIWLQTQRKAKHKPTLATNTVRRLCGRAKQFFGHALKKRLIDENPFAGMKGLQVRGTDERRRHIPHEWIERVLEACPHEDWRVLVVLCRYGGLRPSEACNLRWEHIDWQRHRIRVPCQKTERHAGRAWREIPIFPEITPHLEASWDVAKDGAEMVIARYRSNRNLRTPFEDIVTRAGLEVWKKPFQNLRSTRQTELNRQYPEHVVCGWLGNTQRVAREHYLAATEEDFERAIERPTAKGVESKPAGRSKANTTPKSGPKSGPAGGASGGRQRNGAKSSESVDDEIAVLDAWCRSEAHGAGSARGTRNSPSRIRTYNLAVNSRSLYR